MKTILSSTTLSLLAATCCVAQEFSITGISWMSKDSGKVKMNATIIVTSDKKDGIPPSLLFFDAQAKRLPVDSSTISTGHWEGEFATVPHAIQVSKKVGILPLKAQLKINLPMPESF